MRLEQHCCSINNQSSPSISDCIFFIMFLKQGQTKCIKRLMAATRGDNNERTLIGMVKRWPLNRGLSSHNVLGLFWDFYYWLLNRGQLLKRWPLNGDSTEVYTAYHSIQVKAGFHQRQSRSCNQKCRNLRSGENSDLIPLTNPSFTIKSKLGCQSQKRCDWFILPFLLLTPTIWFSLDCKEWSHKRSQKKMEHSDCSDPDSVESMTLHATPFFFAHS